MEARAQRGSGFRVGPVHTVASWPAPTGRKQRAGSPLPQEAAQCLQQLDHHRSYGYQVQLFVRTLVAALGATERESWEALPREGEQQ